MVDGDDGFFRNEQGVGGQRDPEKGADLEGARMGINMHCTDQPASCNPAGGSHGSDRSELPMGVADPGENNRTCQAVGWDAEERLQLDQEQNQPGVPSGVDPPGNDTCKARGAYTEPTKDLDWRHRAIRHGSEEKGRKKCRYCGCCECEWDDVTKVCGFEYRSDGDEPRSQSHPMEKKERHQLKFFQPRQFALQGLAHIKLLGIGRT